MLRNSKSVTGLHCYQCSTTANQSACASSNIEVLNEFLIDCSNLPDSTQCVKTLGPTNQVTRGCGGLPDVALMQDCRHERGITICSCDVDLCNAGSSLSSPNFLLFSVLFVASLSPKKISRPTGHRRSLYFPLHDPLLTLSGTTSDVRAMAASKVIIFAVVPAFLFLLAVGPQEAIAAVTTCYICDSSAASQTAAALTACVNGTSITDMTNGTITPQTCSAINSPPPAGATTAAPNGGTTPNVTYASCGVIRKDAATVIRRCIISADWCTDANGCASCAGDSCNFIAAPKVKATGGAISTLPGGMTLIMPVIILLSKYYSS
ncbi:hypothetical protein BV898_02604 [Hypsibius exemplaris]|uniref:Protein quiver n=1 Tax=Hypsibius exemplaris TaxID=2072580 RepID=A0A1W0X7H9_HYPEX|nr:hypothetical protein BV898_02604 [Hypsibius exemplaris]